MDIETFRNSKNFSSFLILNFASYLFVIYSKNQDLAAFSSSVVHSLRCHRMGGEGALLVSMGSQNELLSALEETRAVADQLAAKV